MTTYKVYTVKLSQPFLSILDDLVKSGHFANKAEAVRELLRIGLAQYLSDMTQKEVVENV
jgi:Arc/MetJ-type ribon-helix-helix transcriptional regulator